MASVTWRVSLGMEMASVSLSTSLVPGTHGHLDPVAQNSFLS